MKIAKLVTVIILLFLVFVQGPSMKWSTLNQKTLELHRAGKYKRAVIFAQEAYKVAENSFTPDHPNMATSLHTRDYLWNPSQLCESRTIHQAFPLNKRTSVRSRSP